MKIRAVPFSQHGREMYLGVMKASEIAEGLESGKIKVDVWTPDHQEGYQRAHSKTRSKAFGRFIADKTNISPTGFTLSIRNGGRSLHYSDGYITISDNETFWLTDGQHRAKGIEYAINEMRVNLEDFEVPVIILPTEGAYEEAKQFVIINKTQKGVRTDLAERFLQKAISQEGYAKIRTALEEGTLPRTVFEDIEWGPRATEILDELNESSPIWQGRIRLPNVSNPMATVSQKSFKESLKPFLTYPDFKDLPKDIQIKILDNYWMAIRDLMPDAFDAPQNYVLQKTTGVYVFNGILPKIAKYCRDPETGKYELTSKRFKEIFEKIANSEYLNSESWRAAQRRRGIMGGKVAQMGTSQKSFNVLMDIIISELEAAMEEAEEVRTRVIV